MKKILPILFFFTLNIYLNGQNKDNINDFIDTSFFDKYKDEITKITRENSNFIMLGKGALYKNKIIWTALCKVENKHKMIYFSSDISFKNIKSIEPTKEQQTQVNSGKGLKFTIPYKYELFYNQ